MRCQNPEFQICAIHCKAKYFVFISHWREKEHTWRTTLDRWKCLFSVPLALISESQHWSKTWPAEVPGWDCCSGCWRVLVLRQDLLLHSSLSVLTLLSLLFLLRVLFLVTVLSPLLTELLPTPSSVMGEGLFLRTNYHVWHRCQKWY